jgi:transaldolase
VKYFTRRHLENNKKGVTIMSESPVERLMSTHPDLEVWWDSSPLMFESWVQKTVQKAAPAQREELEAQLRRLYNAADPGKSLFRGCTTNPPLSWEAVKAIRIPGGHMWMSWC